MFRYALRRLLWGIPVLLGIVTLAFLIMRYAPGGPFDKERNILPEIRRNIAAKYHLDVPQWKQYGRYLRDLSRGDLGPSFKYVDWTVNEIIADGLPYSLRLGAGALAIAIPLGLLAGIVGASFHGGPLDRSYMLFATFGISIPSFVLAPILLLVFAVKLRWLRVIDPDTLRGMILPCFCLAAPLTAYIARLSRAGLLEVIRQDFIRTARAKGLSERRIVLKHALRLGVLPVVSYLGPACAAVLTGSLVVEKIFGIPGIGAHFVNAAFNRDYTLVLGTVITYSAFLIFFNVFADIIYVFLDPRVRVSRGRR